MSIIVVHYKAWTESTQHKFEDTWQELQLVELVLGKGINTSNNSHLLTYVNGFSWIIEKKKYNDLMTIEYS